MSKNNPGNPDRPPPHALPLARFGELVPELEARWHKRWPSLSSDPADPAEKYFSAPSTPPAMTEDDWFYWAATVEEIVTWGQYASPGGVWTAVQPAIWRALTIVDHELGFVSNEAHQHLIEFWNVHVALAGGRDTATPAAKQRRNVERDARRKNRIELVLAAAARLWPDRQRRPPDRIMANELLRLGKAQGYSFNTLRKILAGTYAPAHQLGLGGDW